METLSQIRVTLIKKGEYQLRLTQLMIQNILFTKTLTNNKHQNMVNLLKIMALMEQIKTIFIERMK